MSFTAKSSKSAGLRFKEALAANAPLPILGTINAYCAKLAEQAGAQAIYLSGGGIAAATLGIPDLGISTCADVVTEIERITRITDLPLLVDIDTGWGSVFNIQRSVADIEKAGAAAIHIEDQIQAKRCGHRPNKAIVVMQEMCDRIKVCVDTRLSEHFIIMARTDALASEGLDAAIERAQAYVAAGADMIFAEACYQLEDYKAFTAQLQVPVLANITEFGKTPLFTQQQLKEAGVAMALYPLSAFRAMSQAALHTYKTILEQGTQESLLEQMQTRDELYQTLDYHQYETILDGLNKE